MNEQLKNRLYATALAIAASTAGAASIYVTSHFGKPSAAVLLAQEIGYHFESSGRHIGTPYVDKAGKGQPWTVCAGITGEGVLPGKYYTVAECKKLETPRYIQAEKDAIKALVHWPTYNVWVRASFIDMAFNVPSALAPSTTIMRYANSGNLDGACAQMTRWVYGTVNGQSARLGGLVDRRDTTNELCAQWGRNGHLTARLLPPPPK